MNRLAILAGTSAAACFIAVPAFAGLAGNASFSHHVPVRVPGHATVVSFDDSGNPTVSPEPGDDKGTDPSSTPTAAPGSSSSDRRGPTPARASGHPVTTTTAQPTGRMSLATTTAPTHPSLATTTATHPSPATAPALTPAAAAAEATATQAAAAMAGRAGLAAEVVAMVADTAPTADPTRQVLAAALPQRKAPTERSAPLRTRLVVLQLIASALVVFIAVAVAGSIISRRTAESESVHEVAQLTDVLAENVVQPALTDPMATSSRQPMHWTVWSDRGCCRQR